jgi:hypothetical protein
MVIAYRDKEKLSVSLQCVFVRRFRCPFILLASRASPQTKLERHEDQSLIGNRPRRTCQYIGNALPRQTCCTRTCLRHAFKASAFKHRILAVLGMQASSIVEESSRESDSEQSLSKVVFAFMGRVKVSGRQLSITSYIPYHRPGAF